MQAIVRILSVLVILAAVLLVPAGTVQADDTTHDVEIGAYVYPVTAESLRNWENLVGRHVATINIFIGWGDDQDLVFPTETVTNVILQHDRGCTHTIPMITVEPWMSLESITNGNYDAQLIAFAQDAAAYSNRYGDPVRIRFAHEMIQDDVASNGGEWYPWQDQPAAYVAAWQHVYTVITNAGATDIEWVWCPNNWPFDNTIVSKYFPGVDYVDWLGMDGYNWTNTDNAPGYPDWQWFDDIFYCLYHTFVDNPGTYGNLPVMIGETASAEASIYEEAGQTKALWITNTLARIGSSDYSRISAFYWFDEDKENDWRVSSSSEATTAFKNGVSGDDWLSHPELNNVAVPLVVKNKHWTDRNA